MTLPDDDAEARRRIRESLDESLVVEAAAGTGKTTELVARIAAAIRQGIASVDRIVAVTFTRKAAGELKIRIRQELDRARRTAEPGEAVRIEAALARLEEARIGTIHSFAADLLRARPVESKVDPRFEEMDEVESRALFGRHFGEWLFERLERPDPGIARALARVSLESADGEDTPSPLARLRDAALKLHEWRDFRRPWQREPFDRPAEIDALARQVIEIGAARREFRVLESRDKLHEALGPVEDLERWIARTERERPRDEDALEARLVDLGDQLSRSMRWLAARSRERDPARVRAREGVNSLAIALAAFRRKADADLAATLQGEFFRAIDAHQEAKRRLGKLDYGDLLFAARDLVRANRPVREALGETFTHLFVDEFQDTDPVQAELLLLLSADDPGEEDWRRVRPVPGKILLVGDPKQSIYRFRRADVSFYREVVSRLKDVGVRVVRLTRSFRAVRNLQIAVNSAFEPLMTGDASRGEPDYVPLAEVRPDPERQPTLVALPVPDPFDWRGNVAKNAIEASLPEATAAFVDWLLSKSGWTIEDPTSPGRRIPIRSGHIALLFRRIRAYRGDATTPYADALEKRGIPHLAGFGRSLADREEIGMLHAAASAIERPDDELDVYATLRGPLFGFADATLLAYRRLAGSLDPLRPAPAELDGGSLAVREALDLLLGLHRARNRRPAAETIHELLRSTRVLASLPLRGGERSALAAVEVFLGAARRHEMRGGLSFRAFLESWSELADGSESREPPLLDLSADEVRILTVHGAKGLEFPVVVLADMTARLSSSEPEKYIDAELGLAALSPLRAAPWDLIEHADEERERDRAEGVRVAYVAATRCRDLLVVPVLGEGALVVPGWTSPLDRAVLPDRSLREGTQPVPGCPPFGPESVRSRPGDAGGRAGSSRRPGLYRPAGGRHEVVWWDPSALDPPPEVRRGVQIEWILADGDPPARTQGLDRYQAWKTRREEAIHSGLRASHRPFSPTGSPERSPPGDVQVAIQRVASRDTARPRGTRFGILVHETLATVELAADPARVRAIANLYARALGATREEAALGARAVTGAFGHPLLAAAREATRVHREVPIALPLAAREILEGSIDLAYETPTGWVVVDYKTDAEVSLERRLDEYRRQVSWYAYALGSLVGRPVHATILLV